MPMRTEALGERIRKLRVAKRISQRELARRSGVSASFLCEIESCRSFPAEPFLERLAEELGVKAGALRKLDNRSHLAEFRILLDSDPAWGPAFKKLAKSGMSGRLTPQELLEMLGTEK
ncbi:MAG: helix-turn-helix transcriptional regulator [Verrucomicrobiota bacterium]